MPRKTRVDKQAEKESERAYDKWFDDRLREQAKLETLVINLQENKGNRKELTEAKKALRELNQLLKEAEETHQIPSPKPESPPKRVKEKSAKEVKEQVEEAILPPPQSKVPGPIEGGETRAVYKCPVCGMMADLFHNSKRHIPSLEDFPHGNFGVLLRHYGGFRFDPSRGRKGKNVGRIEYEPIPNAEVAVLEVLLQTVIEAREQIIDMLEERGVSREQAEKAIKSQSRLWTEVDNVIGPVDK